MVAPANVHKTKHNEKKGHVNTNRYLSHIIATPWEHWIFIPVINQLGFYIANKYCALKSVHFSLKATKK